MIPTTVSESAMSERADDRLVACKGHEYQLDGVSGVSCGGGGGLAGRDPVQVEGAGVGAVASIREGEESLSGGIAELARRSQVLTRDIQHRRWIDVDTPEAAGEAERLWRMGLFQTNRMPPAVRRAGGV